MLQPLGPDAKCWCFLCEASAHNARVTSTLKVVLGEATLHNFSDSDSYRRQRHSFACVVNESDGEAAGCLSCEKNKTCRYRYMSACIAVYV